MDQTKAPWWMIGITAVAAVSGFGLFGAGIAAVLLAVAGLFVGALMQNAQDNGKFFESLSNGFGHLSNGLKNFGQSASDAAGQGADTLKNSLPNLGLGSGDKSAADGSGIQMLQATQVLGIGGIGLGVGIGGYKLNNLVYNPVGKLASLALRGAKGLSHQTIGRVFSTNTAQDADATPEGTRPGTKPPTQESISDIAEEVVKKARIPRKQRTAAKNYVEQVLLERATAADVKDANFVKDVFDARDTAHRDSKQELGDAQQKLQAEHGKRAAYVAELEGNLFPPSNSKVGDETAYKLKAQVDESLKKPGRLDAIRDTLPHRDSIGPIKTEIAAIETINGGPLKPADYAHPQNSARNYDAAALGAESTAPKVRPAPATPKTIPLAGEPSPEPAVKPVPQNRLSNRLQPQPQLAPVGSSLNDGLGLHYDHSAVGDFDPYASTPVETSAAGAEPNMQAPKATNTAKPSMMDRAKQFKATMKKPMGGNAITSWVGLGMGLEGLRHWDTMSLDQKTETVAMTSTGGAGAFGETLSALGANGKIVSGLQTTGQVVAPLVALSGTKETIGAIANAGEASVGETAYHGLHGGGAAFVGTHGTVALTEAAAARLAGKEAAVAVGASAVGKKLGARFVPVVGEVLLIADGVKFGVGMGGENDLRALQALDSAMNQNANMPSVTPLFSEYMRNNTGKTYADAALPDEREYKHIRNAELYVSTLAKNKLIPEHQRLKLGTDEKHVDPDTLTQHINMALQTLEVRRNDVLKGFSAKDRKEALTVEGRQKLRDKNNGGNSIIMWYLTSRNSIDKRAAAIDEVGALTEQIQALKAAKTEINGNEKGMIELQIPAGNGESKMQTIEIPSYGKRYKELNEARMPIAAKAEVDNKVSLLPEATKSLDAALTQLQQAGVKFDAKDTKQPATSPTFVASVSTDNTNQITS